MNPELTIDASKATADELGDQVVAFLKEKGVI